MTPLAWAMLSLFLFAVSGNLYYKVKDALKKKKRA